jgi:pyridoxamine 5'-phosphate oxidase
MNTPLADLRKDYTLNGLSEQDVLENPLAQFQKWFNEALSAGVAEANGMVLSTVSGDGRPHSRVVLVKGVDQKGFVFFTNYQSKKGQEIVDNQHVALNFWWVELERQVRIEGRVEQVSSAESDDYFDIRPRGSQLGAWVSAQSQVIESRETLDVRQKELEEQYAKLPIPRPPHWGGYRVIPDKIEFWQGRSSRLHDRLVYRLDGSVWIIERLSP